MSEDRKQDIEKINELIQDIEIAMLTTIDESGDLHSRPMATQKAEFTGEIWFFTDANSHKVDEINSDQRVNVSYASPGGNSFVSISGTAKLVTDKAKIEELYNPILKAWFPDGTDTPGIALLKITAESAQYWDAPNNAIVKLAGFVKATATGERYQPGENEKVQIK